LYSTGYHDVPADPKLPELINNLIVDYSAENTQLPSSSNNEHIVITNITINGDQSEVLITWWQLLGSPVATSVLILVASLWFWVSDSLCVYNN